YRNDHDVADADDTRHQGAEPDKPNKQIDRVESGIHLRRLFGEVVYKDGFAIFRGNVMTLFQQRVQISGNVVAGETLCRRYRDNRNVFADTKGFLKGIERHIKALRHASLPATVVEHPHYG